MTVDPEHYRRLERMYASAPINAYYRPELRNGEATATIRVQVRKELASQGEIKGDRLILSRKLASKDINAKIEKYVNRFVLCPKCEKPDTELSEEGGKTFLRCLACGEKQEVHKI